MLLLFTDIAPTFGFTSDDDDRLLAALPLVRLAKLVTTLDDIEQGIVRTELLLLVAVELLLLRLLLFD